MKTWPVLLLKRIRLWMLIGIIHLVLSASGLAETFFESRYQYYQENHDRIRVDSDYSLFRLELNDSMVVDGSALYSAISGASPSGLPAYYQGGRVPLVHLSDEREAFTLGLVKAFSNHSLHAGFAYSYESDYTSVGYSLQDTIAFNQKNTELVLGFAFTDDTVGANGSNLSAPKRSYDAIIGLNQILSPDDLLTFNVGLGWRQGFLSDPYKLVLVDYYYIYPDERPNHRFEQLAFLQWIHYLPSIGASLESSYRFGHNDYGSHSHTVQLALNQKLFGGRILVRPSFRYYRQTEADFYDTEFFGPTRYHSSDYRISGEETFSFGLQVRMFAIKDKVAVDFGCERYVTSGLGHKTSQSAYPNAHSMSIGMHYQF
jgi:Protein of unknown function (DUF3570)